MRPNAAAANSTWLWKPEAQPPFPPCRPANQNGASSALQDLLCPALPGISPTMATLSQDQEGPPLTPPAVIASNPSFLCITAKSPTACAQLVLPEVSTVRQLKEEIARHFCCEPAQLVLVCFGRILKDHHTLRQCGVSNGATVHLVIRSQRREQEEPLSHPSGPKDSVCGLGPPDCGLDSPPRTQGGTWDPPEMHPSGTEGQLLPTSEMIIQKVRQVILANPEVQQLAQQVPAIGHILNHGGLMRVILDKMREIMDLARNPEGTQEPKGSEQAAVSPQNNIPGGDNPLRHLSASDPPEPVGQDPFTPPSPYTPLAKTPGPEHLGLGSPGPPGGDPEAVGSLPLSPGAPGLWAPGREEGGPLGLGLAPPHPGSTSGPEVFRGRQVIPRAVQALPMLIVNLCNAYTKRLLFSLLQNVLQDSGGALDAPPEHVRQQVLDFSEQMQSPEVVAAMSNPRAIQAWAQMEQGLQGLLAEAPVLVPWFMLRLRGLGRSVSVSPWPREPPSQGSTAVSE